jgi:hypothetical protein
MKIIGAMLMICGVILAVIGIHQTTVIHAYNMSVAIGEQTQNDVVAISAGCIGFAVLVLGWIFVILKRTKKGSS